MSDHDRVTAETYAERERLAALLSELTPEQWGSPSLCTGWRVREVVAHITMPFRVSQLRLLGGMARAGFSFDRHADRSARADTRKMSDEQLLAALQANLHHPWRPPGGGQAGALSHDVIHGLDITEPLGLPGPPAERIALVLRNSGSRNLNYFGVELDGRSLVATDADITIGDGQPTRMPAKGLLLVVTGRRSVPPGTAAPHDGDR